MGGASTEIAFQADKPENSTDPFYTNEVLFNRTHSIYARSYLCHGHVEAHTRFLGYLYHDQVSGRGNEGRCGQVMNTVDQLVDIGGYL